MMECSINAKDMFLKMLMCKGDLGVYFRSKVSHGYNLDMYYEKDGFEYSLFYIYGTIVLYMNSNDTCLQDVYVMQPHENKTFMTMAEKMQKKFGEK